MKKISKTYCPMPFMHIYNDSSGWYDVCCHSDSKLRKSKINEVLPFDWLFSKEMEEIRNKMLNGEKIASCKRCYEQEEFIGKSKRTEYIKKFGTPNELDRVYIKLRIFGNYCNLSCYMCHPYNSSTRTKELISLDETNKTYWRFDDPVHFKKVGYEEVEKNILDNIDIISDISITGGEPLQSKRMYEFLEKIPQKYCDNLSLSFTTNLTKTEWKGHSVDDILEKFSKVFFSVSCDHFGDKLAWIRHPIDIDEFENNLFTYRKNARIFPTISVLNVEDLNIIINYYKAYFKVDTQFDSTTIVNSPKILTPAIHINRDSIISKYKNRNELRHLISYMFDEKYLKNKENLRIKMFEYLNKLSATRGDWRKLWNEI